MHCLPKPLWSAALHFFKVLACAMDAKLATLGPAGSLGIYIVKESGRETDRQTDRLTYKEIGMKGMKERSQVLLLAKGHWCVYETLSTTYTYITEYRHTHTCTCSSSPRTPSGKISPVFII